MSDETALQNQLTDYYAGDLDLPAGERWVTMTNALTRAGHGLTLAEKRLVMMAVSKLDSRSVLLPNHVPVTRVTASEFSEAFDVSTNTAYDQLKSGAQQLHKRTITFFQPAFKRSGKPLPPTRVSMSWVGQVNYQDGEGWVELYWWPPLLPHLTGLKMQFTTYQLQQASALRSVYSWRLLELLMRFKSSGKATYTMEDFKASMNAPPSLSDFGQVKRRIIDPAVKELIEKDNWLIQWQPIKAGKRVKAINFTFMRDPLGRLPL